MNKKEIRENISCPQFGDNKYGKWGALRLKQKKCIYDLLNEIESADVVIKTLDKRISKAIEYIKLCLTEAYNEEETKLPIEYMEQVQIYLEGDKE